MQSKSVDVLRVGRVSSVNGRRIEVLVDKTKNSSHLLFDGEILRNVSVGSFVKITKGFGQLIGKIESEFITEDKDYSKSEYKKGAEKIKRILTVSLIGYLENNSFEQGIKELPLIDNECYILTQIEYELVHDFIKSGDKPLNIGVLASETSRQIKLGVNSLFASHIGVFGNTGSGKSYTLASIYNALFKKYGHNSGFQENARFLFIDFNGEYSKESSIIESKKVYKLSTKSCNGGNKLPINEDVIINYEVLSILSNATEKTQRPFIIRTIKLYEKITKDSSPLEYFRNSIRRIIKDVMKMADKRKALQLIDQIEKIINHDKDINSQIRLLNDVDFQNKFDFFKKIDERIPIEEKEVEKTNIYIGIGVYEFPVNFINKLLHLFILRLIYDLKDDRAQLEHIGPAINKLESKAKDLNKVIDFSSTKKVFSEKNIIVLDLNDCNLDMKKLIPLIVSKHVYEVHKLENREIRKKYLNIIIDEAHNILSYTSNRESETWKDYRLETFEEIIKEGRKFGVFLTISSQRPYDISATIISQLHNYFLHRLINNKDIEAIERTVSYLDKVSFEAIPILPTGTCVIAGLSAKLPIVVKINELQKKNIPYSDTIKLTDFWEVINTEEEESVDSIRDIELRNNLGDLY